MTSILTPDKLIVRSVWTDGTECVDEFDRRVVAHASRRWRGAEIVASEVRPGHSAAGVDSAWQYEFGGAARASASDGPAAADGAGLAASASTPFMVVAQSEPIPLDSGGATASVRASTGPLISTAWIFRFRNLPYPSDTYDVSVDDAAQEIVLRTKNRKYFKRWDIPALIRARVPLSAASLSFSHDGVNTLLVRYSKPADILARERAALVRAADVIASRTEGVADCRAQ